jgi:hypothetical protein
MFDLLAKLASVIAAGDIAELDYFQKEGEV